jgi:cytochrome c oxidase subunit II
MRFTSRAVRKLRLPVAAIGMALLAGGCAGNQLGPETPVTEQAGRIAGLWSLFVWVAAFIGILVWGLIGWSILRYRRKNKEGLPSQFRYNVPLEILWTGIPIVIVVILFLFTNRVINTVDTVSQSPDLVVEVTAFQWSWQFTYPEQGIVVTGTPGEQPVMVVPTGETIRLELTSKDVVHSFFVPAFLEKRDVFPGMVQKLDIVVNDPGTYQGRCAEFCGVFHDRMLFQVEAVSPDEFQAWVSEQTNKEGGQ